MGNGWMRAAVYIAAVPLVVWGAGVAGAANYKRVYCGPGGLDPNDCWGGFISSFEWAAVAACVSAAVIGLVEAAIRKPSRKAIAVCLAVLALICLGALAWLVSLARIRTA